MNSPISTTKSKKKRCPTCNFVKDVSEFYKNRTRPDGLASECKICKGKYCKEYLKKYTQTNKYKETRNFRSKTTYKERINSYQKKYQKTEKYRLKRSEWNKQDHRRKYYREYRFKREHSDIEFKLSCRIGTAIWEVLKKKKARRKWTELVGYTTKELIDHLESKFEPWMNWKNYGKWHVDHIKPKSLFHYTSPEDQEFKECWSLSNLQPMEAHENMRKSNKY